MLVVLIFYPPIGLEKLGPRCFQNWRGTSKLESHILASRVTIKFYDSGVSSRWYMFILIKGTPREEWQNWKNKNTQYIYFGLSGHRHHFGLINRNTRGPPNKFKSYLWWCNAMVSKGSKKLNKWSYHTRRVALLSEQQLLPVDTRWMALDVIQ